MRRREDRGKSDGRQITSGCGRVYESVQATEEDRMRGSHWSVSAGEAPTLAVGTGLAAVAFQLSACRVIIVVSRLRRWPSNRRPITSTELACHGRAPGGPGLAENVVVRVLLTLVGSVLAGVGLDVRQPGAGKQSWRTKLAWELMSGSSYVAIE